LETLRLLLTEEEAAGLVPGERGPIITGKSGRQYLVGTHGGLVGNVNEVDKHGCVLASLCCHPFMRLRNGESLPVADAWIAQVLAIKFNEKAFRRTANIARDVGCRVDPS
jgi:hypothetical protein